MLGALRLPIDALLITSPDARHTDSQWSYRFQGQSWDATCILLHVTGACKVEEAAGEPHPANRRQPPREKGPSGDHKLDVPGTVRRPAAGRTGAQHFYV
ncbi:hypothetical protein EVAR_45493_1 [Eumeta japonica]|uniref:Uncharacterized protein n=1 Tax=Eumeta variegata TaxID=151549 RepID=A0A4C1WHC0_EUMVA|nr:hypothetical protein EVAR_45493_1 [Eumeta japonica]